MRFSIIVPIYNIEQYLNECINSVLGQDYSDYELILIDDGSTDNSGKICDQYALHTDRIHVIHKHNEGLSMARNCGIDEARGEYVIFLDGDDYWASNTMLSELAEYIAKNNVDVIVFDGKTFWDSGTRRMISSEAINKISSPINSCSFHTFIEFYLNRKSSWGWNSWLYVVKKSIFNDPGLRFPRQRTYEDTYLTWRILRKAEEIGTISKSYYMYRQGRENAITNIKTCKPIKDFIWVIEDNMNVIKNMNIEDSVKRLLMGNFSNGYWSCCAMSGLLGKQEREECIDQLVNKKYLMQYVILPRYKCAAKLSQLIGVRNTIHIVSLRYQWKMRMKSFLMKLKP